MLDFLIELRLRNAELYYYGWVCLLAAISFLVYSRFDATQVMGVNAWIKPTKFAISTAIFSWSIAWYAYYIRADINTTLLNWVVISMLSFEIIYIAIQASKGQLSHYNMSSDFTGFMFGLMAVAATVVTLCTAYLAVIFFNKTLPDLPNYYVWAIRLGMVLFVIFSLQGFAMGARGAHNVGGPDGGPGLPFTNWSTLIGDLRVAHFIGMHALQVLPFLAVYVLKNTTATIMVSVLYGLLAAASWVQALAGKPFYRF